MPPETPPRPHWPDRLTALAGLAAALALGFTVLAQRPRPPAAAPAAAPAAESSLPAAPLLASCELQPAGYWRGSITGSTSLLLDWSGAGLACAGNARPGGRGLRLFFAGRSGADAQRLVFVLGIAAGTDELPGREWPVSVTVIDEAGGDIFHSAPGRCFTQVTELAALDAGRHAFRVAGELYCAGAIGAVSGERAVVLGDSRYAGRLDVEAP
jgi:hypothetical protein